LPLVVFSQAVSPIFKSFQAAQAPLVGVELMHMQRKGQMVVEDGKESLTAATQFHALAA
jgi:hypothetical protein